MKFRALMIDPVSMREFTNTAITLSKLSKECVMRLKTDKLYFIVSDERCGPRPPIIWCELDTTSFFSEYLLEGVTLDSNNIYFAFNTGNLARSLTSLKQNATSAKFKLTDKLCPCLTIEIELPLVNSLHSRQMMHDVPITLISRSAWKDFSEPATHEYNISFQMPSLKQVKAAVDRMKNLSPDLILKANNTGEMILQIKTDLVTVSSRFENLNIESSNDNKDTEEDSRDEKNYIVCRIDIKMFSHILSANQTIYTKMLCSMIHKKLLNLFFEKEDLMTFQCFLPAIIH